MNWAPNRRGAEFRDFVRRVLALRREIGYLGEGRFPGPDDILWFGSAGEPLSQEDWRDAGDRVLCVGWRGWRSWRLAVAGVILVYMNAAEEPRSIELPAFETGSRWRERLNTAEPAPLEVNDGPRILERRFELPAHTTIVLEGELG